jgi:hypothetical protein
MPAADNPPGSVIGALIRDFAIQADRIRDAQLSFIEEDPKAAVVHLRRGLGGREVPWLRADGSPAPPPPPEEPQVLSFGVSKAREGFVTHAALSPRAASHGARPPSTASA